jgi:hypothetical protein
MNTLDDAWRWYLTTKRCSKLVGRLARNHWGCWEENSSIGRDNNFRNVVAVKLAEETEAADEHLADFAVFVLFSVFEGEVRELILERTASERAGIRHPALVRWAGEVEEMLRLGSFGHILNAIKKPDLNDLIEQVNQVRKYRNWVAHGRRGERQETVTPQDAYRRLRALLDALSNLPA